MIQPSPSLAKGLQPPTGAWCHVLGASSASTAPRGWQWGRICCSAASEAGAGCVPLGSSGKAAPAAPCRELEQQPHLVGGKSSQERLHNPDQAAREVVQQQQGQCHSAGQERALPVGPCLWDPAAPLSIHSCLGLLALSELAGFVVQNALGQLEEPLQFPLFWAETAAQQFLFPFHLWQSP